MHYCWIWTIWKEFFNRSHHGVPNSHRSESHEYHKIERKEWWPGTSPVKGIFVLANTVQRPLPSVPNDPITHESIHSSVLHQPSVSPVLSGILTLHPKIVAPLLPFEEEMKVKWAYDPSSHLPLAYEKKLKDQKKLKDEPKISHDSVSRTGSTNKSDSSSLGSFFRVLWIALSRNMNVM